MTTTQLLFPSLLLIDMPINILCIYGDQGFVAWIAQMVCAPHQSCKFLDLIASWGTFPLFISSQFTTFGARGEGVVVPHTRCVRWLFGEPICDCNDKLSTNECDMLTAFCN
jgi:hypothetical protein